MLFDRLFSHVKWKETAAHTHNMNANVCFYGTAEKKKHLSHCTKVTTLELLKNDNLGYYLVTLCDSFKALQCLQFRKELFLPKWRLFSRGWNPRQMNAIKGSEDVSLQQTVLHINHCMFLRNQQGKRRTFAKVSLRYSSNTGVST